MASVFYHEIYAIGNFGFDRSTGVALEYDPFHHERWHQFVGVVRR